MMEIHLPEPALRTPACQRVAGDGFASVQDRGCLPRPFSCRAMYSLRRDMVKIPLCSRLDR